LISRFLEHLPSRNGGSGLYTPWPQGSEQNTPAADIHTIFSVDGSLYQRWQADLLSYSHRKVGQPGPLTRLLSANGQPTPFVGRTFRTEPYCPHPLSGDYYPPYNKPKALESWLRESPPAEEVVLLLDPDCVFLEPLAGLATRGHPIANPPAFMHPEHNMEFVKKHCLRPELVQGVGVPLLIHRDDLADVAPRWFKRTEEIRADPISRALVGWTAEMWGYAFAAAEVGLRHTTHELARVSLDDRADLPIVHYAYSCSDGEKRWTWNKMDYKPWERVPDPPHEVPLATRTMIGLLNEWVAMQEQQICLL